MNRPALLVALSLPLFLSSCNEPSDRSTIALDRGWEFRRVSEGTWRPASVPGCVHTDLLAAGLIDDPFFGTNEKDLQWIENEDWEYRTIFDAAPAFLASEHVEIDFEGLDTYADVYLNDSLLFKADNMFREWKAPCAGVLREKGNELRVYFHSPVSAVRARWDSLGYELPGGARVLTRKAAYQYGWDWAPRFVTAGLWRPVRLRAWDAARITDLRIVRKRVTRESAELAAVFEIEASSRGNVSLSVLRDGRIGASVDAALVPGLNAVSIDFSIPVPKLWWPNGLGEPYLYEFLGEMRDGKLVIDRAARRIGLRTIELVRDRDEKGESFYFRVNGVSVFMKGANFVPMDSFIPRVTADRYESLVASAAGAGMNMLRVWGGGAYESEVFYDLCDEYGILVWQDFMFACAMYPGDSAFLDNVREEAAGVVKRLRNHPCLALWCGNNEIDEGRRNWGWQRQYGYSAADSAKIWNDYVKLFHELLPGVVAELDPGTAYWPSSPSRGRADPRSLTEGDSHYWGVWHDGEAFEAFREKVPRFMSEFGFQSFPSLATIARFAHPEDRRIDSAVMLSHQKAPRGNEIIRTYMERDYRPPRDFESFVYVSRLLQAEGMKTAIEAQRRAKPSCMGSLYWQLNDCWPAASWSSIDYEGDPKALHYFARDAFGEVLVSPVVEGSVLRVYAVSDRVAAIEGVAILKLLDFMGNVIWIDTRRVSMSADSSVAFFESGVERLLRGRPGNAVVFCAELWESGELLSKNLLYFAPPRELDLPPFEAARPGERKSGSNLSVRSISRVENGYSISLRARALVKNLYLSVEGHEGFFDRNYFDMLPGSRETVLFVTDEDIYDFSDVLIMKSLADTY
ncbi:MAG: glycoside hydrolase family 2 protein [Candidatus Krumholzibacteriia bacterium]